MIEGLRQLLKLQTLDDELASLEQERAALPTRRAGLAQGRVDCDTRIASSRQAIQTAEADQRRAEGEARDQEALLAKLEGQTSQVKSNEAYTALLHEMDAAREALSGCETRILEGMEALETARTAHGQAEQEVEAERQRLDGEERSLDAREQELERAVTELRERRDAQRGGIPAPLLSTYDGIAGRRSPAVVVVQRPICEGCRMDIPAQRYIELLKAEEIISCRHCQRILVHAGKLSELADSAAG